MQHAATRTATTAATIASTIGCIQTLHHDLKTSCHVVGLVPTSCSRHSQVYFVFDLVIY